MEKIFEVYKVEEEEFDEYLGDNITIEEWLEGRDNGMNEKVYDFLSEIESHDLIKYYHWVIVQKYHLIKKFNTIAKRHNNLLDENHQLKHKIENLENQK